MTNRLKMIGNSAITETAILIIICCMCATNISLKDVGSWNDVAVAASLVGGLVLFALLIWATYIIMTKRIITEMHPKARIIIEIVSSLLFSYWLYITASPIVALIWITIFVLGEIRSFKTAFCRTA